MEWLNGVKMKSGGIVLLRRHFHLVDHINFLEKGKEIVNVQVKNKSGQKPKRVVWNLS